MNKHIDMCKRYALLLKKKLSYYLLFSYTERKSETCTLAQTNNSYNFIESVKCKCSVKPFIMAVCVSGWVKGWLCLIFFDC